MADRPSRQLLVVPPRGLRWPYLFGATAGLCAGAIVVWTIGSVRPMARGEAAPTSGEAIVVDPVQPPGSEGDASSPQALQADAAQAAAAAPAHVLDPPPDQPGRLDPDADARPLAAVADADPPSDLEPHAVMPPAAFPTRDRPLSRFSSAPGDAVPPDPFNASPRDPPPVADLEPGPLAAPAGVPHDRAATGHDAPVGPDGILPTKAHDAIGEPVALDPPPAASAPPWTVDTVASLQPAPPVRDLPVDDPGAPIPLDAAPRSGDMPSPPPAAASPFAAAPALGPSGPAAPPPWPIGAAPQSTPAGSVTTGQGRPGPTQLEGVQTPQLTVEKRGPREVQVGQSCRYEVIVRNVGAAVAQDVMIHDTVPVGTSLVATSPPASPAGDHGSGDLVWRIGQLPPGSRARVAVELMPTLEGEVGSLASVTFRAEAGARARATKPALALSAPTPQPVLVGGTMPLVITVSNPGTGTATGVVLEGVVPEGMTHGAGRELEFDVGRLAPGQSRSIDLELATAGPGVHQLQMVARADGGIEVSNQIRLEVTAPTLDLAAEIPSRRYLQRPAPCLLSMTNAGTAPAREVELAAQLPPGLKFIRTNNAGYYDERTHRVLWNLEELPAAETGTVELVVMPVELGPQKIVAAARAAGGLADQAVHTIEVEGLAALTFEVTDSEDPIEIGGLTEYVVRVSNQGTKAASGVRLVATLLGDVEPVAAKGPVPHRVDNLAIAFDPLARLAPAEEAVYRVRVRGRRPGDQRVQVQLTSDDHPAPITKDEVTRVYADR